MLRQFDQAFHPFCPKTWLKGFSKFVLRIFTPFSLSSAFGVQPLISPYENETNKTKQSKNEINLHFPMRKFLLLYRFSKIDIPSTLFLPNPKIHIVLKLLKSNSHYFLRMQILSNDNSKTLHIQVIHIWLRYGQPNLRTIKAA